MALTAISGQGCLRDTRPSRERAAWDPFTRAEEIKAPPGDPCQHYASTRALERCEEARFLGRNYVRNLSVGDAVCLQDGFGRPPRGGCRARAAVVDTDDNRVLLEIREADPQSRWFERVQHQFWFEEGALVHLYLAENGYPP